MVGTFIMIVRQFWYFLKSRMILIDGKSDFL